MGVESVAGFGASGPSNAGYVCHPKIPLAIHEEGSSDPWMDFEFVSHCPTGLPEGLVLRAVRPDFGVVRTHAFLMSAEDRESL